MNLTVKPERMHLWWQTFIEAVRIQGVYARVASRPGGRACTSRGVGGQPLVLQRFLGFPLADFELQELNRLIKCRI